MKAHLFKFVLASLSLFILASCSQQQEIVNNEPTTYKYKKVYVGNRIVYRENNQALETKELEQQEVGTELLKENDKRANKVKEYPVLAEHTVEPKVPVVEQSTTEKENLYERFTNNLAWLKTSVSNTFGSSTRASSALEQMESKPDRVEETTGTMMSTGQLFALLGFIFGLLGFLGSGFGIAAAILGIIFSILGLNSAWRTFALIGLILSIVTLVLAIVF